MFPLPSGLKLYGMIAIAVSLLGLSWLSLHLYRENAAKDAECALSRQGDADTVSTATHKLAIEALRDQVLAAQRERTAAQKAEAEAEGRQLNAEKTARSYRKELNDALSKHPELNRPLDVDARLRLCHAQSTYYGGAGEDCRP